jgi:hypothetical protein
MIERPLRVELGRSNRVSAPRKLAVSEQHYNFRNCDRFVKQAAAGSEAVTMCGFSGI